MSKTKASTTTSGAIRTATNGAISAANASRRKFIAALSLGGATAAAVVVLKPQAGTDQTVASNGEKPADDGYQLTSHIRNYYRTTQV